MCFLFRTVLLADPLPAFVLGPQSSAWVHQQSLDTYCSTTTYERALQLALMEHALGQPLSCLLRAVATGSRQKLQTAVEQLAPTQLERCCEALAAAEQELGSTGAAAGPQTQGGGAGRGRGGKVSEAAAAAAAGQAPQLVDSVWSAMLSYSDWRTGLLLLQSLADFTGGSLKAL